MSAVEMDVFAFTGGAVELTRRDCEGVSAVQTPAVERCRPDGQLRALGQSSFGKKLKAGGKGPGLHAGKKPEFTDYFLDAADGCPVRPGVVVLNRVRHKVEEPQNQTCLMHQRSVQETQGSMLFRTSATSAIWQPFIITESAFQFM